MRFGSGKHGELGLIFVFSAVVSAGCASAPPVTDKTSDPKQLYEQACSHGAQVKGARGSVWLKAKSKEASGQFPAMVNAQTPNILRLEVTNPLGGTEAVITVSGSKYWLQVPGKKDRSMQGYGSWGGIPLHWATELFLGKIPCPPYKLGSDQLKLTMNDAGELIAVVKQSLDGAEERYTYRFGNWNDTAWPESMSWERKGAFGTKVDFVFGEPEDETGSPRKWEAKSPQGEVKVKWRDRDTTR